MNDIPLVELSSLLGLWLLLSLCCRNRPNNYRGMILCGSCKLGYVARGLE